MTACPKCGNEDCGKPPRNVINDVVNSRLDACEVVATKLIVELTIDGEPVSKQRPRFAMNKGGHVYTPTTTKQAQAVIGWSIKSAYRMLVPEPDGAFAVWLHFFTKDRQRRDIDNMCKLVFDACNGIVWRDDAQVEWLNARVTRASSRPRTEIEIFSMVSDTPFIRCKACKRTVRIYPSTKQREFCSRECVAVFARNGIDAPCDQCGTVVHRANHLITESGRRFCSRECRSLHETAEIACSGCGATFRTPKSFATRGKRYCSKECQAVHAKIRRLARPRGKCGTCGGPTSRKEYERCRACLCEAQAAGSVTSGGRPRVTP